MFPTPERNTYKERDRNPINRIINKMLDKVTDREIKKYVSRYAVNEQGVVNEPLAQRIRFEVLRRSEMGREIDVLEPLRATFFTSLIGLGTGTAAKVIEQRTHATGNVKTFLRATTITGFAAAIVTMGRILSFARFKAGLYAGAQTALALHEHEQETGFSSGLMNTADIIKSPDMDTHKTRDWYSRVKEEARKEIQTQR